MATSTNRKVNVTQTVSKKPAAKPVAAESSSTSSGQNEVGACASWHRPHWQVELLQQQSKLQLEVEVMQAFRNDAEFYRTNKQMQDGFIAQLNATRNLLDAVNERISYFL